VVSGCLRSCRDACPCPFNGKAVTPWQALPSLFFFSHREKSSEPKNIIAHCLPALRVPRMPSSPTFICCDHEMFKTRKSGGKKKKRTKTVFPFKIQQGIEFGAASLGGCSDCFFNFCLYNFTKFWQESRAHTRVLAFMNLMGCESQADWMNFGYIFQTSTMTLFIQTWQPERRLTLWVINFHSHKTSAATNLIPRRKNACKEADWGCKNMLDYYSMYVYQSVNLFGY